MIKGLYTSASGMMPNLKRQEATANNIANAGVSGFKKDAVFSRELSKAEKKVAHRRTDWEKPMVDDLYTDYSQGHFSKTGNQFDLAIEGDGFFTLQLDDGTTALTRSGSFSVSSDGLLSHPSGGTVLGEGGPIEVLGTEFAVAQDGEVQVDGTVVGRIVPQTVENLDDLEKIGGSLFAVPEGVNLNQVQFSSIRQGFVENSNVDIVREMVDMIISFRAYEANSKAVKSQDNSLNHLFQRVGLGR